MFAFVTAVTVTAVTKIGIIFDPPKKSLELVILSELSGVVKKYILIIVTFAISNKSIDI